jgi:hypothetical protein
MPATNRSRKKQSSSRGQKPGTNQRGNQRWVAGVKTVSTFPPKGLFTKDAHTIAIRPKDQAPECGCLPISLIARDAASARFGAKCWSGLSESSRSRRKDKGPTNTRERPDRRSKLYQALRAELNPSSEIATPVFPRHPGCLREHLNKANLSLA